ncbi:MULTISPECIES: fimbrial protein [unclassified Arsenophonus]|uniref:fimbrial protein n=1 Tax=unclassified Arsenophonus TaxID=2627083 RepID=UPI0030D1CB81
MGTVFKKDFRGKGSTTGERTFNIEVNCKDVNQAYITWQGGNSNGVIPADTNSTATGVGIQIFANNTPIYFNKKLNINFSKQLTYSAKFYQTDNSVSAGTVNATATFTIDYIKPYCGKPKKPYKTIILPRMVIRLAINVTHIAGCDLP